MAPVMEGPVFFVGAVTGFVDRHRTMRILALSFLLLIGMALVADGMHHEIPRGCVYFAMGFSVFVELLNLRFRGRRLRPSSSGSPAKRRRHEKGHARHAQTARPGAARRNPFSRKPVQRPQPSPHRWEHRAP